MVTLTCCYIILAIIALSVKATLSKQTITNIQDKSPVTNEWMFQFNILNKNDWDHYQITKNYNNKNENINPRLLNQNIPQLTGKSIKCTDKIPAVLKYLCVEWNHNDGFKLNITSISNTDTVLWFNKDNHWTTSTRRSLMDKYINNNEKCYWNQGNRICAQLNKQNNLLNTYIAVNDYFGAKTGYNNDDYDYGEYDDDYMFSNELYSDLLSSYNMYDDYYSDLNDLMNQQLQYSHKQLFNNYNFDDLYDDDYDDGDSKSEKGENFEKKEDEMEKEVEEDVEKKEEKKDEGALKKQEKQEEQAEAETVSDGEKDDDKDDEDEEDDDEEESKSDADENGEAPEDADE